MNVRRWTIPVLLLVSLGFSLATPVPQPPPANGAVRQPAKAARPVLNPQYFQLGQAFGSRSARGTVNIPVPQPFRPGPPVASALIKSVPPCVSCG
jgi:hypothetical protein